jgi:hypothetical protein
VKNRNQANDLAKHTYTGIVLWHMEHDFFFTMIKGFPFFLSLVSASGAGTRWREQGRQLNS